MTHVSHGGSQTTIQALGTCSRIPSTSRHLCRASTRCGEYGGYTYASDFLLDAKVCTASSMVCHGGDEHFPFRMASLHLPDRAARRLTTGIVSIQRQHLEDVCQELCQPAPPTADEGGAPAAAAKRASIPKGPPAERPKVPRRR